MLATSDISLDWVTRLSRDLARTCDASVSSFELEDLYKGVSSRDPIVDHHVLTIRAVVHGRDVDQRVVLKSKVPGAVIRERLETVYARFDVRLAELQHALAPSILDDCHTRELHIYELECLRGIAPVVHRVWIDPAADIFVVAMELLANVRHANTLDNLDVWETSDIDAALSQIARVHGKHLGMSAILPPSYLVPFHFLNNAPLRAYQAALLRYNAEEFPELFDRTRVRMIEALIDSAPARHRRIMSRPLTLIHGDFTPRNVCFKGERLCAYDWELAQVHLPQRDVCELLCYVLNPAHGWKSTQAAVVLDGYRMSLAAVADRAVTAAEFRSDLAMALAEFCTFKLLVQGITHQLLGKRAYFDRLVHNTCDGIATFQEAV